MLSSNRGLTFTKYFIIFAFFIALISGIITISNFLSNPVSQDLWNYSNKGLYYFIAFVIQLILMLVILLFPYQLMQKIDIKDYFNTINHDKLFLIATLTLIYGSINISKSYLKAPIEYRTLLDTTIDTNQILFILSVVILTSLSIYEESKKIKEENDLTI